MNARGWAANGARASHRLHADRRLRDSGLPRAPRADFLLKSYADGARDHRSRQERQAVRISSRPNSGTDRTGVEMLERLAQAGIEVSARNGLSGRRQSRIRQARTCCRQRSRSALPGGPAGAAEVSRAAEGTTGPTKSPYDIAGWTLTMQMAVAIDRVDNAFDARLESVEDFRPEGSVSGAGSWILMDHRENGSFLATAFLLDRNEQGSVGAGRFDSRGQRLRERSGTR